MRSHATNAVVNEQLFVCVFRSILDLVRNMVLAKLRHFDVYRKLPLDLTQPTTPGAILSIISITAIVILFTSELVSFLQVQTQSTMYIAQDDADDKLKGQCIDLFFVFNDGSHCLRALVNFDVSFPSLPCMVLSVDIQDSMQRHVMDVETNVLKERLDRAGKVIGVYSHDNQNQESEAYGHSHGAGAHVVKEKEAQDMKEEGCRVSGFLSLNKVPGNFHVSAHGQLSLISKYLQNKVNASHTIHSLWVGSTRIPQEAPGTRQPLDGVSQVASKVDSVKGFTSFEYYLDLVPTVYKKLDGSEVHTYQMTATNMEVVNIRQISALWFRYSLSPIVVEYTEQRNSFLHFVTYSCAIVGGVFTVAGLISSVIDRSVCLLQKKSLGKLG